jgi:preprotein translocase subunit SecA
MVDDIFILEKPEYIVKELRSVFSADIEEQDLVEALAGGKNLQSVKEKFSSYFAAEAKTLKRHAEIYEASQHLILQVIDNNWSSHLELMDMLKEEANLFSYASEDPLLDFIAESRKLFAEMGRNIQRQFISSVFKQVEKFRDR